MRPLILSALLLAALTVAAQPAPERYSEVRLPIPADGRLAARLAAAGVGLDHAVEERTASGRALRTVLNARELATLRAAGVPFEVLVADLAAEVAARPSFTEADRASARAGGGIEGNVFGSMGGYPTYTEALAILDSMRAQFPSLISERASLGPSVEGRGVWMVELSDNPGVDEGEPEVLYTAVHHAREPQGLVTVLYFLWHLLENYGTDPEATYLLDHRRLFVVPILNPDGYVYNEATDPGGGGFWRKNRRDNGDGSFGVDLNRNYGYEWGYDDNGSSPWTDSDTYRGAAPFSEPELQALKAFLEGGRQIRTAFNYHTYSDLLLWPWGFTPDLPPDAPTFDRYGRAMTEVNGYTQGPGHTTIYPTNGSSDDWMYGETTTKPRIFSFTPEVGSTGFWPTPEEILPLAEENLRANYLLAWFAGGYPGVAGAAYAEAEADPNGYIDPGEGADATFAIANVGQEEVEVRVRLRTEGGPFVAPDFPFSEPAVLTPGDTLVFGPLSFLVVEGAPLGDATGLAVEMDLGGVVLSQPLPPVRIGTPQEVFADDAASLENWTTGGWGLTSEAYSPPSAFTESPNGDYPPDADRSLTLEGSLDLSGAEAASLRFRARWDIEGEWDFAQVYARADGGPWTPLAGQYTRPGSGQGAQPEGEPGYDGLQTEWVEEGMDLSPFAGSANVQLRFRLRSDGFAERDGWLVDDVVVETLVDGGSVAGEDGPTALAFALDAAAPNPTAAGTRLAFALPAASDVRLTLYDALGRRVRTLVSGRLGAGRHEAAWDGRDAAGRPAAAGAYFVRLDIADPARGAAGRSAVRPVTVLR